MRGVLSLVLAAGTLQAAAEPLRVLFLGNSYTYYNHLAGLVEGFARAAGGRPVEARSVTLGGATLETLYRDTGALSVLRHGKWDVVVLQEQSTLGVHLHNGDAVINLPTAFHTWARVWDGEIRARGARTVFLQTWARRGRREQQPHLNWSYAAIAKELDAGLIPAGMAFQLVDGIELHQPDGSHPSAAGSYLAACVAVQVLAGGGCAGAPSRVDGIPMDNEAGRLRPEPGTIVKLDPADAERLQRAALAAVRQSSEAAVPPRPAFGGEGEQALGPLDDWAGRWEGSTWLYGKQAGIVLSIEPKGESACEGTWHLTAADPGTETTIPLQDCTVTQDRLQFRIRTLFLTNEQHVAAREGATLRGRVTIRSATPYLRQEGTWTLRRGKP